MLDVEKNWQTCLQSKSKNAGLPKTIFSMNRRGDIAFNDAAWIAIERPLDVQLFYDATRNRIGIKKCAQEGSFGEEKGASTAPFFIGLSILRWS